MIPDSPTRALAFYGRTPTAEFPDPATSRAWQREMAEAVIADRGVIVVDFFDLGCSQRVPWERRSESEAVALLEQARWLIVGSTRS